MYIALIGYRGTGKTAVAPLLARRLGWQWVDADVEIEQVAGKSIARIFAEDGEPAFRNQESAVLSALTQRHHVVIACGGGAVLREENRRRLASGGKVVWLRASLETILRRVQSDATTAARRPNLTSQGGEAEVRHLLAERSPLYQQCADLGVTTDDKTPQQVVDEIVLGLREQSGNAILENA